MNTFQTVNTFETETRKHPAHWQVLVACALLALAGCSADGDTAAGAGTDPVGDGGGGGGDGGGGDGGDGGGGGTDSLVCSQPIAGPGADAVGSTSGLCVGCAVNNPQFAVDTDPDNFAEIVLPVGLLGGDATLTMTAPPGIVFPAGMNAGVIIAIPPGLLASAGVLANMSVTMSLAGTEQETADATGLLRLSLLGTQVLGADLVAVSFDTTMPFDSVALTASAALANVLSTVEVHGGCGEFTTVMTAR